MKGPKRPSLARKFKPNARLGTLGGTDESDGSGPGEHAMGGVLPVVVGVDDEAPFNMVTPLESSVNAGRSGLSSSSSMDPDEMLFHKARTAHEAEQAQAKPIMPDTPMKRHPMKARTWQSASKAWPTNAPFDGTIRGGGKLRNRE